MDKKTVPFDKNESLKIKGIAIMLMLYHHSFRLERLFDGFAVSFAPLQATNVVNMAYASKICVSMFTFISGYGLYQSYKATSKTAQRWIYERYVKTFSGYWFVWVFAFVSCQIINGRSVRLFFSEGIIKGITYIALNFLGLDSFFNTPSQDPVWWYMGAALVFIMLTPLIYKCKDNLFFVLIAVIILPRAILGHDGSVVRASGTSAFAFLSPFVSGAIFSRYNLFDWWMNKGDKELPIKAFKFVFELWCIVFLYKMYHNLDRSIFWEIHYGLFPMVCIVFLVEFVIPLKWLAKPLMFLGKHSMNMYLIHAFLLLYCKRFLYSWKHFILITLMFLAMSVLLSVIIEFIKRRMQYQKLISFITMIQ